MARAVEGGELVKLPKSTLYDFPQWADGQLWVLEQGVDYEDAHKLRGAAYAWSRAHGMRAKTSLREDGVHIQFEALSPVTPEPVAPPVKPKKKLRRGGVKKNPQLLAKLWLSRHANDEIQAQRSKWTKTLADICAMQTMKIHAMNKNGEFTPQDYDLIEEFRRQQRVAKSGK